MGWDSRLQTALHPIPFLCRIVQRVHIISRLVAVQVIVYDVLRMLFCVLGGARIIDRAGPSEISLSL